MRRRNKFGAKKTTVNGILFSSRGESERYAELRYQELAGEIKDLILQRAIDVFVKDVKVFSYVSDYFYFDLRTKSQVVEDFKGVRTAIFNLKWKIVRVLHPEWEFRISKKHGNKIRVLTEIVKKPRKR